MYHLPGGVPVTESVQRCRNPILGRRPARRSVTRQGGMTVSLGCIERDPQRRWASPVVVACPGSFQLPFEQVETGAASRSIRPSETVMPPHKDKAAACNRAEEAQVRLAAIVTSSADAIVGKTLDGIVTSWNEAAERLLGYSAGEMVGQSIRHLAPTDRQQEEDTILARLARSESVQRHEMVPSQRVDELSTPQSPFHLCEMPKAAPSAARRCTPSGLTWRLTCSATNGLEAWEREQNTGQNTGEA
jgi:PAS domain-containing protein